MSLGIGTRVMLSYQILAVFYATLQGVACCCQWLALYLQNLNLSASPYVPQSLYTADNKDVLSS